MTLLVIASDFGAQYGYLADKEKHIESSFTSLAKLTNHGNRLIQDCSDHKLFRVNRMFHCERSLRFTWCLPLSIRRCTQVCHFAIGQLWYISVADCRSFLSASVDCAHVVPRARLCRCLVRGSTYMKTKCSAQLISDGNNRRVQVRVFNGVSVTTKCPEVSSEHWEQANEALYRTRATKQGYMPYGPQKW